MTGCKPTDFFTEVIITSNSDIIDEKNPNVLMVNDPDAKRETDALASLDISKNYPQTDVPVMVTVWSDTPNSDLITHPLLYGLPSLLSDLKPYKGVRVVYDPDGVMQSADHNESDDQETDAVSNGASGSAASAPTTSGASTGPIVSGNDVAEENAEGGKNESDVSGNSGAGKLDGTEGSGNYSGGDASGDGEGSGESDDPSENKGRDPDYKGYGGSTPKYNPNGQRQEVPQAERVAVLGKQTAVLVQALGGKGAICALGSYDYDGQDAENNYNNARYSSTFADVFGSRASEWDVNDVYMWTSSASDDFSSIDVQAFIEAVGFDGVVIYDSALIPDIDAALPGSNENVDDPTNLKRELYGHNIRFLPVDMSTLDGMEDAAYLVGQCLRDSGSIAANSDWGLDVVGMAEAYSDTIESLLDENNGLRSESGASTAVSIAVDSQHARVSSSRYNLLNDLSTSSQLVMYADHSQGNYKPLNAMIGKLGLQTIGSFVSTDTTGGYTPGRGALALMTPLLSAGSEWTVENRLGKWYQQAGRINRIAPGSSFVTSGGFLGGGLGSATVPYLIVCGNSEGQTAAEVAQDAEQSIWAKSAAGYSLYYAYNYDRTYPVNSGGEESSISTIGSLEVDTVPNANPLRALQSNVEGSVRANPTGYLGSWTDVSFESILEAAWLAGLYSYKPYGDSTYVARTGWLENVVCVGGEDIELNGKSGDEASWAIVEQFYSTFYRTSPAKPSNWMG